MEYKTLSYSFFKCFKMCFMTLYGSYKKKVQQQNWLQSMKRYKMYSKLKAYESKLFLAGFTPVASWAFTAALVLKPQHSTCTLP